MDKALLAELAHRFLSGTATDEEKALLHQWYDITDREEIELVFLPKKETEDEVKTRIMAGIQSAMAQEPQRAPRRIGYYARWIAAAAILVAVSITGLYFWKAHRSQATTGGALPVAAAHKDLQPGGNKATLLLGDGSTVNLGAAQNGVIRKVAGMQIDKQDGLVRYSVSAAGLAPEINTIQTPRGGQYQVVLPDGTKVWLNAASSLTYPTAFTGEDRTVQLKGEAYFEVAGSKSKPFKVMVGDMQINVLGTHFNVMAYEDENEIKTTLLEGAVNVTKGGASHLLKPGQEGRIDRSSDVFKLLDVNASEAVAWKNGVFQFGGASIETVMREIVRWYDVDVEYQGRTNEHFRGTISRGVNASEVFKMLELTGAVHFTIADNKIIVKP
ncbi:MAG: FecR family protein [Bacteroidetes bacterium]|nr:FecR family protein [Bacteroidota bacterium]